MSRNIELKARLANFDTAHQRASSLGAALDGIERQVDTYFRAADGRLKLRERWSCDSNGSVLQAFPSQLISYQRVDAAQARPSDYSLVVVENGAELRELLSASLGMIAVVDKLRTIYLHEHVRIHLDEVAELGSFIEFEAIVDDSCDDRAAHEKLERFQVHFGIAPAHIMSRSYAELIAAADVYDRAPPKSTKHPPQIELSTVLVVTALCAAVFGLFKLLSPAGLCFAIVPGTMIVALIRTCWE